MLRALPTAALAAASFLLAPSAQAVTSQTFDSDVTRASSKTPGAWYTDRYAPAGFEGGVIFDGDERLRHSIAAADGANDRNSSFVSSFYNTQGRKYDTPGAKTMSIDLYVASDWETSGRRMAGFWGTTVDGSNAISGYPIIEFTSTDNDPRFRWYTQDTDQDLGNGMTAGWIDMGLPTGFTYDSWYTLSISLSGSAFTGKVGDLTITDMLISGSTEISNAILQGYNTTEGVSYDIHWDNFSAVVPVPFGAVLIGSAFLVAGAVSARARRKAA